MAIKIDFEFQTEHGVFRDALHLDDGHGLASEQIEAMKAERRDNWLAIVTAPAPEPATEFIEIDGVQYVRAA